MTQKSLADVLTDVTVREGSQQRHDFRGASIEDKLRIVALQQQIGIQTIELTAFAPGEWFQDAGELAAQVKDYSQQMKVKALYFNIRGAERLLHYPYLAQEGVFHTAATDEYRQKNYRQNSLSHTQEKLIAFLRWFKEHDIPFQTLLISTAWGGKNSGLFSLKQSMDFIEACLKTSEDNGVTPRQVTLADTEGIVDASSVGELTRAVKKTFPMLQVSLHLHPQEKEALSLVQAGIDSEVDYWEGAWLSVGGSPLAAGGKRRGNLNIRALINGYERNGLPIGFDKDKIQSMEEYVRTLQE